MRLLTPLLLLAALLLGGCASVKPGMTKAEIVARYGEPKRTLKYGGGEALIYEHKLVALENGQVRSVPGWSREDRRSYLLGWAEGLHRTGALTQAEFETWQQAAATLD
jgi:hypothetical protein